mmetsp:Transcript_35699/g.70670  ORF Transcript_35699/g.70670 Transcript_35699/m.70670 type:complete len:524 (-) Transcript_35699:195-1766(-)
MGCSSSTSTLHCLRKPSATAGQSSNRYLASSKGGSNTSGSGKGKGKGKGGSPPPKACGPKGAGKNSSVIGSQLPVPIEDLHNRRKSWNVAGSVHPLETDEAFTAAFEALGSQVPQSWRPVTRESFQTFPKWKQQQLIGELAKEPPYTYSFPHQDVLPLLPLDTIDWSSVVGVELSSAGMEGVVFVELANRQAVCVKVPRKPATEIFGTTLCERLGARCPGLRCLHKESAEGKIVVDALTSADSNRLTEQRKVTAAVRNGGPVLLIYEYLKARDLANVLPSPATSDLYKHIFGVLPPRHIDNSETVQVADLGHCLQSVLRLCGSTIAFDMIVHNYDRLPCIWDNKGNPENLMLDLDVNAQYPLVTIDNQMSCIPRESGKLREAYFEKVRQATEATVLSPDVEHAAFAQVRQFLCQGCVQGHGWPGLGVDVGKQGTLEVQRGFLEAIHRAAMGAGPAGSACLPISRKQLAKDLGELESLLGNSPESANALGLEQIDCDFCASVVDIFRTALQLHQDLQKGSTVSI